MDDGDEGEEEGEFQQGSETHDNNWSNFSSVVKSGKV